MKIPGYGPDFKHLLLKLLKYRYLILISIIHSHNGKDIYCHKKVFYETHLVAPENSRTRTLRASSRRHESKIS
jgi:hypothetical protein